MKEDPMQQMARWILLFVAAIALQAQSHVALSARTSTTTEKVTLQLDPANQTRIQACAIVINATVAGTVYTEVAGTAATATLLTAVGTSPGARPAKAKAYSASDVGSGTATSKAMVLEASKPFVLNLKAVRLAGAGTTKNVTIVIALGSSGDVTTSLYWAEDDVCYN